MWWRKQADDDFRNLVASSVVRGDLPNLNC